MIRLATHSDIERLCAMGEKFWSGSPWAKAGPFSKEKAALGFAAFIENENVGLFVIDRDGDLSGALCVLVSDLWTVDGGVLAQELFWWVERDGSREAMNLLSAGEDWAKARGAPVLAMIRLEGMRDAAIDRLYKRRGYEVREHLYTRAF